ncbi:hypothetical protein M438DRAFT_68894 [Aureobasidium pullulans EXF-150]|uniref:Uncharacterized protein n=1 Tax=Aureobasidium pullulans EXF-150 TaxID=1043002 RepID=A0A074Y463_AURPU|nr:uncharacterized protein M438DRAFT_68894 [Aureobasidium pullulans EXF-150]KEQ81671.1 hypothetical protein M438DRAFT_68894 [Aureobasidium pullulans EXF-150]
MSISSFGVNQSIICLATLIHVSQHACHSAIMIRLCGDPSASQTSFRIDDVAFSAASSDQRACISRDGRQFNIHGLPSPT